VYNRRFLDETLQTAIKQAMNENLPLSIVMLDIDHFKEINDIYGHKAGDLILQELANKTQTAIRDGDLVCRFGGDEFVIILPNVSKKVANQRAEQVRKNIEEILVDYKSIQLKVTSSMGIAVYPEHGSNADLLLRAADKALYAAKLAGRNRVTIFDPDGDMNTVRLNMPPR
jgi:diguanylate cyclase (GGDEF)-like protein